MSNRKNYRYYWDLHSNKKSRIELANIDRHSIRPSNCYRIGNLRVTDAFYSAYVYEQMVIIQNAFRKRREIVASLDGPIGNVIGRALSVDFDDDMEEFYDYYNKVPKDLFKRVIPLTTIVSDIKYEPLGKAIQLRPFAYNEEFYFSILDDVFKSLDDEKIYDCFKTITNPKNRRLFITPHWENDEPDNLTFIDTFNQKAFSYLNVNHNIGDLFTLGGAILHMCIRESVARSDYEDREERHLYDIEKHFFSFVLADYIKGMQIYGDSSVILGSIRRFETIAYEGSIEWAFSLMAIKELMDNEDPEYIAKGYREQLRKELDWHYIPKTENLEGLLNSSDLSFYLNNLTSYLAARDIYAIYVIDKEEALAKLMLNASLTTPATISLDLIGTTFAHDNYSEMVAYGKQLKQRTRA